MKVIQTFSFAPFSQPGNTSFGGFSSEQFFWYTAAASMALARKHYDFVELHTDSVGAKLVSEIGLKYDRVLTTLDNLPEIAKPLWAFPKLFVYSLQEEPFLHMDTDVLLWQPLPKDFLLSPVFGQSLEVSQIQKKFYIRLLTLMRKNLAFLPDHYYSFPLDLTTIAPLNCGVFGGTRTALIAEYARESMEIIACKQNEEGWRNIRTEYGGPLDHFNCAVEQINIQLWCQKVGIRAATLFSPAEEVLIEEGKKDIGYTHLVGPSKKLHANLHTLDTFFLEHMPKTRIMIDRYFRQQRSKRAEKELIQHGVQAYYFSSNFSSDPRQATLGGFPQSRFFFYCWWLSLHGLRRSCSRTTFYSNLSADQLPFREVGIEYDEIKTLEHPMLQRYFNLIKFLTYKEQCLPFLYTDLDCFVEPAFPPRFLQAPVCCESPEFSPAFKESYTESVRTLTSLPYSPFDFSTIDPALRNTDPVNCGVFGGHDLETIHFYADTCCKIVLSAENDKFFAQLEKHNKLHSALVALEQVTVGPLLESRRRVPTFLIGPGRPIPEMRSVHYNHLFGANKRDPKLLGLLEQRMLSTDAAAKKRIDAFCRY